MLRSKEQWVSLAFKTVNGDISCRALAQMIRDEVSNLQDQIIEKERQLLEYVKMWSKADLDNDELREECGELEKVIIDIDNIVNNPLMGKSYEDEIRKVLKRAKEHKNV